MLAEAFKFLSDLGARAEKPFKIDLADPRRVYVSVGGVIAPWDIPPAPRAHTAGTLDEVIALAVRFVEAGSHPVVWYDQDDVTLVIDDDGHRVEQSTLTLVTSDVFRLLVALRDQKPWHDPRAFVRLLRVELAGTLTPGELLERVKVTKFEGGSLVSARVGRGDESLGREITSRLDGSERIPEEVTLMAPVYKTPGETERYAVRCAVEVDPARCAFQLLPLPDEIERVRALAVASIGERLIDGLGDSVPCYQGRP